MYPINFAVFGMICIGLAAGFAFAVPQVLRLWPWSDGPLSYLFIASILAAFASGSLLVAWSRDWRAAAGGGIALAVGFGAMAVAMSVAPGTPDATPSNHIIGFAMVAIIGAALFLWSVRFPCADPRPTPLLAKASTALFSGVLLVVGIALTARVPNVFPWPLKPATSTLFGLMFIGLSLNYYYVLARGRWGDAQVSLLGFLAYDLVLIGPFLRHFANVGDAHRLSLIVYTSVLIYSALLAAYYLFLDRKWRLGMGGRAVSSDA